MAVQHAFTGAYENKVGQQLKGINTITQGVKDTATLVGGIAGMAMGGLTAGSSILSKAMVQNFAGRVGGIGGNLMVLQMQQKMQTNNLNQPPQAMAVEGQVQKAQSMTPFDMLSQPTTIQGGGLKPQ